MRVWLDDVREMPEGFDVWAKNVYSMLGLLVSGNVTYISFDHDLGYFDGKEDINNTGYYIATAIEKWSASEKDRDWFKPIEWDVHSDNPVGRKNIEQAMKSAERFWNTEKQNGY